MLIHNRINKFLLLLVALVVAGDVFATHNRAGEIIYRRVNDNPFLYEISIITYTKTGTQASDAADRCELELFFGDGTSETVSRVNGPIGTPNWCEGVGLGEDISGTNIRYNVYTTTHEFPGSGTYKLSMEDPMRNGGVVNIPDSDNVPFYIESYLTIDIATGGNQAPVLRNPPIDNGCVNMPFYHNPGAIDPEGDSLVYSIVGSRSYGGSNISGYVLPDQVEPGEDNKLSIDPVTGTMSWIAPQLQGEYNVAILIEEYRKNKNSGAVFKVGSVMRDMQIDIGACLLENDPPVIELNREVCVTAGNTMSELIRAFDPDSQNIVLTAVGYPLDPGNGGYALPDGDVLSGDHDLSMVIQWPVNCSHVRVEPYWMYFKAKEDTGQESDLVSFETMQITVNAPPVQITSVLPEGTSLRLQWTQANCSHADGYDIYRYNDSLGYEAPDCRTGVPASLGYELIGSTKGIASTTFLDNNDGIGLVHGQRYCYMIVTRFKDGGESYPSAESCGRLIRDVPILNKVSVNITDAESGADSIAWFKPIDLKTDVYSPPFRYRLSRSLSPTGTYEEVYLSDATEDPFDLDTLYVDENLNTKDLQYFYRIELLSGESQASVGAARHAASIYLTSEAADNRLYLSWDVDVPWNNYEYVLYRFKRHQDSLQDYKVIDTVFGTTYIDSNLANLQEYRYFVRSIGEYTEIDLKGELINFSQIHTGIPKDVNPPCVPPDQLIIGDCDLEQTTISWSNPNETCSGVDDVLGYRIYFAPFLGDPLEEYLYIDGAENTTFVYDEGGSIAGCYAVVAVDSFGNESARTEALCVDNCPSYELPNVFTPGGDNINDYFEPFPYKFVESIDLTIYNRWGVEVFSSFDPDINWDGTDARSGEPLPEGVYYYVCQVNEIRLTGIESRELKGAVHLLRDHKEQQLAP